MKRKSLSCSLQMRKLCSLACVALFTASLSSQAMALSLPLSGKKGSLQLPMNERLEDLSPESAADGSAPADSSAANSGATTGSTNTGTSGSTTGNTGSDTTKSPEKPTVKLAPLKLNNDEDADIQENGGKVFQLHETKNDLAPAAKEATGLPTQSMKPGKDKDTKKKLSRSAQEAAAKASVQPIALLTSPDEVSDKSDFLEKTETKQIAALWEATLNRSPDIQFVIQRMVPTSKAAHGATVLARMLSNVVYAGIGSMGMIAPNQGTYAAQNFAASALGQLTGAIDSKEKKNAQLGEAELIALYNMVRTTADKLVDKYRDYKKSLVNLNRATTDFQDLNNMMKEARQGQDAAKQLEMEYTVRKAQRDMVNISDDIHRYRQSLIDMAGNDAVEKLDKDVQGELQNLGEGSTGIAGNSKSDLTM